MKRISVVMSAYSEPLDWIKQSVDSILHQSYRDFEFIIVNDKPERKELGALLVEYAQNDNRIAIITNEGNIGLTKSLNKAIKIAQGEFIARMDADDYSHPERFEKQIAFLDSHTDVVMVGCYARVMNEKGRIIGRMKTGNSIDYLKAMIPFTQPVYHPSMMFRRIINDVPVLYNEEMKVSQDFELCSRLIRYPITNIPAFLLDYRMSASQMTKVFKESYIIKDAPIRKMLLTKFYEGITPQDADAFINMYYRQKVHSTALDEVDTFILHFYRKNKERYTNEIRAVMMFVLARYIKFLLNNVSKFDAVKRCMRANSILGDWLFLSLIGYGLKKKAIIVKYKLLDINSPAMNN